MSDRDPASTPDVDPALAAAVLEIESHIAEGGWDQPSRLYALVDTAALVRREPDARLGDGPRRRVRGGLAHPGRAGAAARRPASRTRSTSIAWAAEVAGCAAVVERLVLPPDADDAIPDDPAAAAAYAREHPDRQEVRIVVGVTRAGATYCALRLRAHDDDQSVVGGADLVPELITLLGADAWTTDLTTWRTTR